MSEGEGLKTVDFEADGGGYGHEGAILIEADWIDNFLGDFVCIIHQIYIKYDTKVINYTNDQM